MLPVNTIAVVGAGIMGHGIAQVCAQGGKKAILIDSSPSAIEAAKTRIAGNVDLLKNNGLLKVSSVEEVVSRIEFTNHLNRAEEAEIVIEAVPEKFAIKAELFRTLEGICSPDTIFATNTSGIPITKIADVTRYPARVIGAHFYMPAHLIPLVEITQTKRTDEQVIDRTMALMREIGKKPVRVRKDIPGFIGNRLQHALAREAMSLVEKGVASPEDIDTVVKTSLAIRLVFTGPMEQRDFNGLDTHLSIAEYLYPDLEDAKEPLSILREKVAAGHLGLKSGIGFYDWRECSTADVNNKKNQDLINLLKYLERREM